MKAVTAMAFFFLGTMAMITLFQDEVLLLVIMALASLCILGMDNWKRTRHFLTAMFVGGACENIAVYLGAWGYSNA